MATSKNYGEKKGSDHFRDILNPYGEKSNYGKSDAGAACLS
jgi:hypothetical protein